MCVFLSSFWANVIFYVSCLFLLLHSRPFDLRATDIVSRLTIDEKIAQMSHGGANRNSPTPAIPRLQIKPYQVPELTIIHDQEKTKEEKIE